MGSIIASVLRVPFMAITACLLALTPPVLGGGVLNPATHTSPSGRYSLHVDPGAMNGAGPARYRMMCDGEELWAGARPFSLWEAGVTDNGIVAGYAYEGGVESGGHHGARYDGLAIYILDADGNTLARDTPNDHDADVMINSWAGSESPDVRGMIIDVGLDRLLVRVPLNGGRSSEVWWTYKLSTGERAGDFIPERPDLGDRASPLALEAHLINGTPLVATHWYTYLIGREGPTKTASISLLTPDGKEVWRRDFPGEYDSLDEAWSPWSLIESGEPRLIAGDGAFGFRSYSERALLTFTVHSDASAPHGWRVEETGRVAEQDTDKTAAPLDTLALEHLGTIRLAALDAPESTIRGVVEFAIDARGRIGLVQWGRGDKPEFVLADPETDKVTVLPLPLPDAEGALLPRATPLDGSRWIIARAGFSADMPAAAWWLDTETGGLTPLPDFPPGRIVSLDSTGDGGFIVLSSEHSMYTIQNRIARFDASGALLWTAGDDGYGGGVSPDAAAWLSSGGVAAITTVPAALEFFESDGSHSRSVKLGGVLGHEPNYPAGIAADLDGGIIFHDFNGSPPIYRISRTGEVTASFRPRFPDGRLFTISGDVKVAPNGSLWTSDTNALIRLSPEGVADKVIGPRPDDDSLSEVAAVTLDSKGNIYAVNARTASVHVFDRRGAPLRIMTPLPSDWASVDSMGRVTVDGEGACYYKANFIGGGQKPGYLGFDADGHRIGFQSPGVRTLNLRWIFTQRDSESWALGYDSVHLLDAQRRVRVRIDRRPDRNWIERVEDGAVAPDGSLALVAAPKDFLHGGQTSLCVYGPAGEPRLTMPIRSPSFVHGLAFDGAAVVVQHLGGDPVLYRLDGSAPVRLLTGVPGYESEVWTPLIPTGGNELWLVARAPGRVERFRMPE